MMEERIVPECAKAAADFTAKRITEQEMWQIIHKYMGVSCHNRAEKFEQRPLKGDLVTRSGRNGLVLFRTGDAVHLKWFDDNSREEVIIEEFEFANYSSKGGRTLWQLEE